LTPTPPTPATIPAGRVGRPHGLDGSFYVTRPSARLLTLGARVSVAGRALAIVRRAGTEQRPIVRLEGVEDREAALALRGAQLDVAAAQAPALAEGEFWAHELEGCEVLAAGRRVGRVSRLLELPSCEALEIELGEGAEPLLVPMVKDAILDIRVREREIDIDLDFVGAQPPAGGAGEG
jgi:16S rRNA processing protein RimM